MRNYYLWLLATVLLGAAPLTSAEIIPVWHNVNEAGEIHDMEFLRGEDQFILIAGTGGKGQIQIRQTLTGELVKSYPVDSFYRARLAITPDSNRFVLITGSLQPAGATIELRNINDFSLIKKDSLINSKDEISGKDFYCKFTEIVIDPIRPYAYVILEKADIGTPPRDSTFLIVYNYETMQRVRDLTPVGFEAEYLSQIAVSKDGKYLATLNEGKAYLKVWDLGTMELIKDIKLWDDSFHNSDDYWCEPKDIEFSSINSDVIYFSGSFPFEKESQRNFHGSFRKYNIITNEFYDYWGVESGKFILFDNEERVLVCAWGIYFMDILKQKVELYVEPAIEYPFYVKVLHSEKYGLFVGCNHSRVGSLKYDSQTGVETGDIEEIRISPNPTSDFVNISLDCSTTTINYSINDTNGLLLFQTTAISEIGNLQIDFSTYPVGVYFLTLNCNNHPKTYKIIKEN
ncbi:T9SS type A sorting domain-containing protein [bacterium]|nr:MAG: T9SS type A sorting domain-containing protein [bacterium]